MMAAMQGFMIAVGLAAGVATTLANDQFADAIDLTGQPLPYYRYQAGSGTAETGEPAHAGSPAAQSFWFEWQSPVTRVMAFGEYLNGSGSRIGIYTGTAVDALTKVADGISKVFFLAEAGVRYHIAIDSPGADYVYLRTYPEGGADDQADAPALPGPVPFQVEGNNVFATVEAGDPDFGPEHPADHTVWWRWPASFTGGLRVDARLSDFGTTVAIYERPPGGAANRVAAGLDSAGCAVTSGNDYLVCVGVYSGDPGQISLWFDAVPAGPPPNDQIAAAVDLGSGTVVCDGAWLLFATSEAGLPGEDVGYPQWGVPPVRTLWWKWTCPASGDFRISTLGSNLFAGVLVYTGGPGALNLVDSNPDTLGGVRIPAVAGTTYWIQVRDYRKVCSRAELNIHPALHEPTYFQQLEQQDCFRMWGAGRHPDADHDGDGFANELELACGTSPQVADVANPKLPHLASDGAGGWRLRWNQDTNFLLYSAPLPMTLVPMTASTLGGPWSVGTVITDGPSGSRQSPLPAGTTGFGRIEFTNPNWSMDP